MTLDPELSAVARPGATCGQRRPLWILLLGLLASCRLGFDVEKYYYAYVEGRVTSQAGQPVAGATVLADHVLIQADGTCEIQGEIADAGGRTNTHGEYRLRLRDLRQGVYCLRIGVVPPEGSNLLNITGVEAPNVTFRADERTANTVTVNVTLQSQ